MKKLLPVLFLICPSLVISDDIDLVKGEFSCQVTDTVDTKFDGSNVSKIPSRLKIEVGDLLTVSYSIGMGYLLKTELLKGDDKLADLSDVNTYGGLSYTGDEERLVLNSRYGQNVINHFSWWSYYTSNFESGYDISIVGPDPVMGIVRDIDFLCDEPQDQDFQCTHTVYMKCDHTVDRLKELLSVSTMVFEKYK